MRTTLRVAAVSVFAALILAPPAAAQEAAPRALPSASAATTVAPGITLDSFDRVEDQGRIRGDAVTVDLTADIATEYLSAGSVAAVSPIPEQVEAHEDVVLAFNADFFDIKDTGGALGTAIADGELLKSATTGTSTTVAFDADGRGSIETIGFTGTAATDAGTLDLHGLNVTGLPADAIGLYNADWGTASRARVADGVSDLREVTIVDGVVSATTDAPVEGAIPDGSVTLVGREAGADALAALAIGDAVTIDYAPVVDGEVPQTAVAGDQLLIEDGAIVHNDDPARHPRTAVGFSEDGLTMYAVTYDGRQAFSGGYTLDEVAEQLLAMGAHSALNLDGGGSSTLLARVPGTDDLVTVNDPSDGTERAVANGIALTVPDGDGEAAGFAVAPQSPFDPGAVQGAQYDRVFPGLTRPLWWAAHDAAYGPAEATPNWTARPGRSGSVDDDAVFHAGWAPGKVTVIALSGDVGGATELTVLGSLAEVTPSLASVALADRDAAASFQLIGADSRGVTAPIDPADIDLDYDSGLLSVEPDGLGGYTVAAKAASGSGTVELTVAGHTTTLDVTIG